MNRSYTLSELAEILSARVLGDKNKKLVSVKPLDEAGPQDLSFFHNRKYLDAAKRTRAGAVIVGEGAEAELEEKNLLVAQNPYVAFAKALELFYPPSNPAPGVHPMAVVEATAKLGEEVHIGPFAYVGHDVVLGDRVVVGPGCVLEVGAEVGADTILHARVVIRERCKVGKRCIIHPGVVIGSDGFGFATAGPGVHLKVPQVGRVVIEDDVELGANVTVDRATLGATVVGQGTKVDNLVQIGHNVKVGPGSILVAQVGIAGSTELGARVIVGGQSGFAGHLKIGDDVKVGAKSAVLKNIPDGEFVTGIPARPHRRWLTAQALPTKVAALERRLARLEDMLQSIIAGKDHGHQEDS